MASRLFVENAGVVSLFLSSLFEIHTALALALPTPNLTYGHGMTLATQAQGVYVNRQGEA